MRISVVGTGYVGLVTGACFSEMGNDVVCVDVDEAKVESLRQGRVPIYEPGLQEMVQRNLEQGRLAFSSDTRSAAAGAELVFVAVGTPADEDGSTDLRHVFQAAREIAEGMDGYRIIVNKSTVPVGTADRVREAVAAVTRHPFDVVSNPEFLKEGAAIEDFMRPDRVVVGTSSPEAAEKMRELYAPFTRTGAPILVMDARSAEMTKYVSNALLASRISFMNEMANFCELLGADIHWVRQGVGLDRRIGPAFLFPGVGYGGSCFPKDIRSLLHTAARLGHRLSVLSAVEEVNQRQKEILVRKLVDYYSSRPESRPEPGRSPLEGRKFAVWGLSFKPQTDDMREAPSLAVIGRLLELGAGVQAYDPKALGEARKVFGERVRYCRNSYEALEDADALLLVTEWNEFRHPDFGRMKSLMKRPVIFDGRNQYDPKEMRNLGFLYFAIGRPVGN